MNLHAEPSGGKPGEKNHARPPIPDVRLAALAALKTGCCVLPPAEDGKKRPLGAEWKSFQAERSTVDDVHRWYGTKGPPKRTGLGVVTGAVSGNLEVLDFDAAGEAYQPFKDAAVAFGLGDLVERIEAGYLERSASAGVHWAYRCAEIAGNTKLANRYKTPAEFNDDDRKAVAAAADKGKEHKPVQGLIETRGEGGYIVTAPSHGRVHPSGKPYVLIRGGFDSIATITPEEREALLCLAKTFDQIPKSEPTGPTGVPDGNGNGTGNGTVTGNGRAKATSDVLTPWDDFNGRMTWPEILTGWTLVYRRGDTEYWRRAGKSEGWSATVNHKGSDRLYVFSTSTEFEADKPYSKFDVYAKQEHAGNAKAAIKTLSERGYGEYQTWVERGGECVLETRKNPCPKGTRIARPGEGPPVKRGGGNGRPEPGANGNGKHETPVGSNGRHEPEPEPIRPNEAADDPSRLARLFIDGGCRHPDGLMLRYWQGNCLGWDGGAYRAIPDDDVRARIHPIIKGEFDRLNVEEIVQWERDRDGDQRVKKGPPKALKVTRNLVADTVLALAGYTRLAPRTPQPSWLDGPDPFPADDVLPARNALIHLPGFVAGDPGSVIPPTPRFFCPYSLDYDFDPAAPRPARWLAFLESLWPDDPELSGTLQEWFGHLLTPDTSHQKILMMIGPKRSGRGTIARVIRGLIGAENVANPTLSGLATNFGIAPLIGKPAAVITDARMSGRTDVAQVVERLLAISGEDAQTIDRKHLAAVTVKLPTRFAIISNELPKLTDASGALPSRLIVLPMTRTFYGKEDRGLTAALLAELPGILLWAIEGWRRLRERGWFIQPAAGKALVEAMEDLASPTGAFLKDRCRVEPGAEVMAAELYREWKDWCQEHGRDKPGDEQVFGRNLRAILPGLKTPSRRQPDGTRKRFYEGIGLFGPVPKAPEY
jgi:putative DNA primase/helicase